MMGSIYDTYDDEYLIKKLKTFEKLIWFAAKRFSIPGVLQPDDLYQEGLIALEETLAESLDHPDSAEFSRTFKSRLFHKILHILRRHKTASRDWRLEVRDVLNASEDGTLTSIFDTIPADDNSNPEYIVSNNQLSEFVIDLRRELKKESVKGSIFGNSYDDALEVLDIVINYDPMTVPEEVVLTYERVPGHLSSAMISEITGWDIMKVRRALSKLRKEAAKICPKYGIILSGGLK